MGRKVGWPRAECKGPRPSATSAPKAGAGRVKAPGFPPGGGGGGGAPLQKSSLNFDLQQVNVGRMVAVPVTSSLHWQHLYGAQPQVGTASSRNQAPEHSGQRCSSRANDILARLRCIFFIQL